MMFAAAASKVGVVKTAWVVKEKKADQQETVLKEMAAVAEVKMGRAEVGMDRVEVERGLEVGARGWAEAVRERVDALVLPLAGKAEVARTEAVG